MNWLEIKIMDNAEKMSVNWKQIEKKKETFSFSDTQKNVYR